MGCGFGRGCSVECRVGHRVQLRLLFTGMWLRVKHSRAQKNIAGSVEAEIIYNRNHKGSVLRRMQCRIELDDARHMRLEVSVVPLELWSSFVLLSFLFAGFAIFVVAASVVRAVALFFVIIQLLTLVFLLLDLLFDPSKLTIRK